MTEAARSGPYTDDSWAMLQYLAPKVWLNGPSGLEGVSFETVAAGIQPSQLVGEGQPSLARLSRAQAIEGLPSGNGHDARTG